MITEQGVDATPEVIKSFIFCLGFNVRMMFMLLQVLLPELEDPASGEELPNGTPRSVRPSEKITAIASRIFPALRQYSVWLASGSGLLLGSSGVTAIQVHVKEMWKMYADVLTRLANFFPVADLASVNYLLEEDESTVGFLPLRNPNLAPECDLFLNDEGKLKPRITDLAAKQELPHIEMQARVRSILLCGLHLQLQDAIPVVFSNANGSPEFVFVEEGLSLTSPIHVQGSNSSCTNSSGRTNGTNGMHDKTNGKHGTPETTTNGSDEVRDESVAASDTQSMDTDMNRMVDSLLEPSSSGSKDTASNETSYGMHSATANEVFAPMGSNGFERLQSTPKMLPSLPGFYNSAFTPQPNELQPHSPNRPLTARQLSPLSLQSHEQRIQAAIALDHFASGYGRTQNTEFSWGRPTPRPLSHPISQPVNQLWQESIAHQYMPSSGFSESSSIYVNNTPYQHPAPGGPHRNGVTAFDVNSTIYPGGTDFDKDIMLQSSLYNGSQSASGYIQTPPGGQGG